MGSGTVEMRTVQGNSLPTSPRDGDGKHSQCLLWANSSSRTTSSNSPSKVHVLWELHGAQHLLALSHSAALSLLLTETELWYGEEVHHGHADTLTFTVKAHFHKVLSSWVHLWSEHLTVTAKCH